ncbi:MAG TPA: S8 family serine peptidase, partial [Candidatus Polarisedimenticolia bacterium]|nr:S8 family serine peptidase [Candidatus Polarisedimenticolia bacterium]
MKRTRLLFTLGLVLVLACPAMLLWASRPSSTRGEGTGSVATMERAMEERDLRLAERMEGRLPAGFARPDAFAVFGHKYLRTRLDEKGKRGLLATNLGDLDVARPEALLVDVPEALRLKPQEFIKVERGALAEGLNYLRLSDKATSREPLEAVVARVQREGAKIVGSLKDGWVIAWVDAAALVRVGKSPDIDAARPVEPWGKIASDTGERPMIERARATNPLMLLEVYGIHGVGDAATLKRQLEQVHGVASVTKYSLDGLGFLVKADYRSIGAIARLKLVGSVSEDRETMLLNAKNAPTVQMGSVEDGLGIRPFDQAGVDGGGIDTNGDGRRINNGTDAVPPQLVLVTDNGVSYDTPSFSQTTTQPESTGFLVGPTHRKIHTIQNVAGAGDGGNTCDATLSGAGTHGTVVASAIAAFPSQLGFFATRSGIGGPGQPRNSNMDGVARGARIIVQDAADSLRCTTNSLIERGGNISPGSLAVRLQLAICPSPVAATTGDCAGILGGGSELHLAVLPFGFPDNFQTQQFLATNGTYPEAAADLDTFLYNNRDFMIVSPVGNNGGLIGNSRPALYRPVLPDLFNGTSADDDPNLGGNFSGILIQIQPPSTAKNIVSVGAHVADCVTFFGTGDCQEGTDRYSSKGPATGQSLRMAPILTGPADDLIPSFDVASVAAFRSKDNDNAAPIEAELDEGNFGTSFAAAYVTGGAAIVRDYFAQGFYPTGIRADGNRLQTVSGALVKAALVASANFGDNVTVVGQEDSERNLRRTRAMDLGMIKGVDVGVMGNSEQGYGRTVLTQVLPLANWSPSFSLGPNSTIEHPAAGLLAWDSLSTGEPLINNTRTSASHLFRVNGPNSASVTAGTGKAIAMINAQLRIALAWPDPPSPALSGGSLINDLDLVLESPGADGCLGGPGTTGETKPDGTACPATGTTADNLFYDGNVYNGGRNNAVVDQWSKPRPANNPPLERHDRRNPQEAIHITSEPNGPGSNDDSQLYVGLWRVTVQHGFGGTVGGVCDPPPPPPAAPIPCNNNPLTCAAGQTCKTGQITITGNVTTSEDINPANGRLDPGEDTNLNGTLDLPGQAYALVVSGPVFAADATPPSGGPQTFPKSTISFDKIRYSCSDSPVVNIFDTAAGAGPSQSSAATTFAVIRGTTIPVPPATPLDTETRVAFSPVSGAGSGATRSAPLPLRASGPAIANNGILEADTATYLVATYAPAGQAPVTAQAQIVCTPELIPGFFTTADGNAIADQFQIANGCDNDDSFDAGETVTYSVALANRSRVDDYGDVVVTLTPSGFCVLGPTPNKACNVNADCGTGGTCSTAGASALRVLDSPRNIGRLPGGQTDGVTFHVFVDPTKIPTLPADRKVIMIVTLDSLNHGVRLARQTYSFTHPINSNRETFHYSTDYPAGSPDRVVRDLSRNLNIDKPDTIDPFLVLSVPDEDIKFDTMFVAGAIKAGTTNTLVVSNTLGEDLNDNGVLDAGELDVTPNGVVDRGILASGAGISAGDKVPWNFDRNDGGWVPVRHPASTPGNLTRPTLWEYKTQGLCGFQTACHPGLSEGGLACPAAGDVYGIWHTGDGDQTTPASNALTCDSYAQPSDPSTRRRVELVFDVLHSPIIAKVNQ